MVAPLVMAILLLGGEPDRDSYAAQLSFEFHPPLEVFASSPSSGALERLSAVDQINKLVLSYEARNTWQNCWWLTFAAQCPVCPQALDTVTNFSTMIPRLQEVAKLEDVGGLRGIGDADLIRAEVCLQMPQ
eukprot:s987_g1.t1